MSSGRSQQAKPAGGGAAGDAGGRRSESDTTRPGPISRSLDVSGVQLLATPASISRVTVVRKVILNELLAYIECYRHNSNDDAMQKVVLTHFSHDEIADAKRLMVQEFQSVAGVSQFITERRSSSARPAHEAELEDILGIMDVADTKHVLTSYAFVASNFMVMPKYGPEEVNLGVVVDRQVQMKDAIANLSASVQKLVSAPPPDDPSVAVQQSTQSIAHDLAQQLGAFNESISARLDHLNAVCVQLAENAAAKNVVITAPRAERKSHDIDRSQNLMVFGVAEDRNPTTWRRKVDQALLFVAGTNVDVCDMFRVGRFDQNKIRPILVKLRNAWDKRIVLINSSKLKDYSERIFIASDEPIEERRKKILARIKSRAEVAGKTVSVVDGVLSVDNIPVFSIKDGKINHDGGQS
jgi:hypothetical protein